MKHIPDKLWCEIEKLIPKKETVVGRPEFDRRKTLDGIIYILYSGAKWSLLPEKYGCYTTVHGKFMLWSRSGVFRKIIVKAREYYRRRNSKNNWHAFDTISRKAPFAKFGGKSSTDRAKQGIKHSVLVDRKGAPLFVDVAPGNRHDAKLLDSITKQMRKSNQLRILAADSAFDAARLRSICKEKNIALIAAPNKRRNQSKYIFQVLNRWIVEQTFGILSWIRGLKICWAKTYESALSFLQIACSLRLFKMGGI